MKRENKPEGSGHLPSPPKPSLFIYSHLSWCGCHCRPWCHWGCCHHFHCQLWSFIAPSRSSSPCRLFRDWVYGVVVVVVVVGGCSSPLTIAIWVLPGQWWWWCWFWLLLLCSSCETVVVVVVVVVVVGNTDVDALAVPCDINNA